MHFTTIVIGDNPEDQMAPFQDNNMGDCPKEYLTFIDMEEDLEKDYETKILDMVKCSDGELMLAYNTSAIKKKYFSDYQYNMSVAKITSFSGFHECKVPAKKFYKTLGDYVKDYCGYTDVDEVTGKYGYYTNENAAWDYYKLIEEGTIEELGKETFAFQ